MTPKTCEVEREERITVEVPIVSKPIAIIEDVKTQDGSVQIELQLSEEQVGYLQQYAERNKMTLGKAFQAVWSAGFDIYRNVECVMTRRM